MPAERVLIMGAAGRDFHTFNVYFRNHPGYQVVAFTASQIPGIEKRSYPAALSGARYPNGIPIYPEEKLESLIRNERIDQVVFAYSDVSHLAVMHLASRVLASGANFVSNPLIDLGILFELFLCYLFFYTSLSQIYYFAPVPWHVYLFAFHGTALLLAFEEAKKYYRRRGHMLEFLG